MLYRKSDQVMLEWLRGSAEVGQYSVAVRVAESLYFLPVILSNTLLPRIGQGSGDFDGSRIASALSICLAFWVSGMMLVSMLVLPPLLPLVFGNEFLPAQSALVWLGPAAFCGGDRMRKRCLA